MKSLMVCWPWAVGVLIVGSIGVVTAAAVQEPVTVERALGKWRSADLFEGEPRVSMAFRQQGQAIDGLSFGQISWNGQAFRFSTILPDDEGTIGWEFQVSSPTKALLVAVTENGQVLQDGLEFE